MINRYNILQDCKTVNHLQGFVLQVINSFAMLQDIVLLIMKKVCDFGSLSVELQSASITRLINLSVLKMPDSQ